MTEAGQDWGLLEPLGIPTSSSDDAVYVAMVEVECALLMAWSREDGAPDGLGSVADGLRTSSPDRAAVAVGIRSAGIPVIAIVDHLQQTADAALPNAGQWIHRGATSQDILDTALVLVARRALFEAVRSLDRAGTHLARIAEEHRATPAVARTLTQHAAPSTAGAAAASWLDGVSSSIEGLRDLTFPVQLGGSVGTGETFDVLAARDGAASQLRSRFALFLDLSDPGRSWHTERTPILRLATAAAAVAVSAARIGRDLALLSRTEVGEVRLATAGASSAMPNKQNPVDAVLLTANGLRAPGLLSTVVASAVSSDARPAGEWHAEWVAFRELLRLATTSSACLETVTAGLTFDAAAAARNLLLTGDAIGAERRAALGRLAANGCDVNVAETASGPTLAAASRVVAAAVARFHLVRGELQ